MSSDPGIMFKGSELEIMACFEPAEDTSESPSFPQVLRRGESFGKL